MPPHCVSHERCEESADFFKDHRDFQPHCVSHRVPRELGRRHVRATAVRTQALAQPVRAFRRGFALAPALAGPPMTLALAVRSTAHVLPVTGAGMWTKPLPADPTRSTAVHLVLRNKIGEPHCTESLRSTVGQF